MKINVGIKNVLNKLSCVVPAQAAGCEQNNFVPTWLMKAGLKSIEGVFALAQESCREVFLDTQVQETELVVRTFNQQTHLFARQIHEVSRQCCWVFGRSVRGELLGNTRFEFFSTDESCWLIFMHPVRDRRKDMDDKLFVQSPLAQAQVDRAARQTAGEVPCLGQGFDAEAIQIRTAVWQACALVVNQRQQCQQQ